MSSEQKRNIVVFLCIITVAFSNLMFCGALSVESSVLIGFNADHEKASNAERETRINTKQDAKHKSEYLGRLAILRRNLRPTVNNSSIQEQSAEFIDVPENAINNLSQPNIALKSTNLRASLDVRNGFNVQKRSLDYNARHQTVFKGFEGHGFEGKVYGPSADHNPHSSEWLSMRPLVQCNDNLMMLTASGRGYTHLLVDRAGASPISLFQLPPSCGYHVKTTWREMVMMAPYDGCYIMQEHGSYVLPMLWWGSPVKITCPVPQPHPVPPKSVPSVLCSHFGLAIQIHGGEEVIHTLQVIENGEWVPFVSEDCAYQVESHSEDLIFYVPFTAPCVTIGNGVHRLVLLDGQDFILSCPSHHPPPFPFFPSPPFSQPFSPGDLQHQIPDPVTFAPSTSPPPPSPPITPYTQPPAQEQMPQLPAFPHHLPHGMYPQIPHFPYGGAGYHTLLHPGHDPYPGSHRLLPGRYPGQQPFFPMGPGHHPYGSGDPRDSFYLSPPPTHDPMLDYSNEIAPRVHRPSDVVYPTPLLAIRPLPPAAYTKPSPPAAYTKPSPPAAYTKPSPPAAYTKPSPPAAYTKPSPPAAYTKPPPPLDTEPVLPVTPTAIERRPYPIVVTGPPPPPSGSKPSSPVFQPPKLPADPNDPYGAHMTINQALITEEPVSATGSPNPDPYTQPPKWPVGPYYYPYGPYYPPSGPHHYPFIPIYYPSPTPGPSPVMASPPQTLPPGPQDPTMPTVYPPHHHPQPVICSPSAHTICSYYPYPVDVPHHPYPLYLTPSPPLTTLAFPSTGTALPGATQPPQTTSPPPSPSSRTISTTTTLTPWLSILPHTLRPQPSLSPGLSPQPSLRCLAGQMIVSVHSALLDSIQVKDQMNGWVSISSAPAACRYILQMSKGGEVILHSPLPACHSQAMALDPHQLSLPLKFWDTVLGRYRTLELHCPSTVTPSPHTTTTTLALTTHTRPPTPPKPHVFCSARHMRVELPPGPISGVVVKDIEGNEMSLKDAPKHCGYVASKGKDGMITLNLPFNSCHMTVQGKEHRVDVIYSTLNGQKGKAQLSCPVSIPVSHQECNLPSDQRLPCGPRPLSQAECLSLGCCYSTKPSACYYSMDECTLDRHFVFSVPASLTYPPLSPALLTAAGNPTCAPQRVTPDYALFKIPLGGCGAHRYEVGQTVIYMVEIISTVQSITLNYGTITRDSPIRLLVECRYTPGSVVSDGFLVKSPSLGPSIQAQGVLGVQLRIATDVQYSSFYPQYHRPLQMLLGKPLHLEVRLLNPPDDKVVLLVHYCVAYPRSGQTVWVLLYNGCPNYLDPASQKPHPSPPPPPFHQGQTRRFTISTFQFLTSGQTQTMEDHEEIYFMCSTEVCSPLDGSLCVEGCFGQ
uniref:ZP domain-containing protein n=1 Tax=Hucho hucho TaxID=62062 RepID=A0A4W5PH24_9TELE